MITPVKSYNDNMQHIVFNGIGTRPDDAECVRRFETYIEKQGGGNYLVWAPRTDPTKKFTEFGPEECPFMIRLGYDSVEQVDVYHCSLWIQEIEDDEF